MQRMNELVPLALAEAGRLLAKGNKARDVAHKKGKQGKKQGTKPMPKQLRLAI